jgi:hypothetical protein
MRERQPDGMIRRWTEAALRETRADGVGLPAREAPVYREERPGSGVSRNRPGTRAGSALAGSTARPPWWEQRGGSAAHAPAGRWLDADLARGVIPHEPQERASGISGDAPAPDESTTRAFRKRFIYAMGVNRNHLEQAIRELGLPAVISRDDHLADAVLVLKSLYRKQNDRVDALQSRGIPVYVLRSASVERLREALADLYRVDIERLHLTPGATPGDGQTATDEFN